MEDARRIRDRARRLSEEVHRSVKFAERRAQCCLPRRRTMLCSAGQTSEPRCRSFRFSQPARAFTTGCSRDRHVPRRCRGGQEQSQCMTTLSQSNFKARTEEGFPESVRVASTSGHRTLRSILKTPADHSAASQAILDGAPRPGLQLRRRTSGLQTIFGPDFLCLPGGWSSAAPKAPWWRERAVRISARDQRKRPR